MQCRLLQEKEENVNSFSLSGCEELAEALRITVVPLDCSAPASGTAQAQESLAFPSALGSYSLSNNGNLPLTLSESS